MYTEYNKLSQAEKKCYMQIAKQASRYQTSFSFKGLEPAIIENAFKAVLDDNPQFFRMSEQKRTHSDGIQQII